MSKCEPLGSKFRILCWLKEGINSLAEAEVLDDWTCREYRYLGALLADSLHRVPQWIISRYEYLARSRLSRFGPQCHTTHFDHHHNPDQLISKAILPEIMQVCMDDSLSFLNSEKLWVSIEVCRYIPEARFKGK